MIISIDQSRQWRGRRAASQNWARLLDALFHHHPERRPASSLEVVLLSRALQCPEAAIERHRAGSARLVPMDPDVPSRYSPTMPA